LPPDPNAKFQTLNAQCLNREFPILNTELLNPRPY
jgi:hypothetical protein